MDYTSIPIVAECCNQSENIRDYFLEERYLLEVEQQDELTPELVSIIAIDLVLEELSAMGLETNYSAEELLQSTLDRNVMFYLRQKYDKDNYYRFLKGLTEEQYGDFCGIIEACSVAQDLLIELTDFATTIYPADTHWELINCSLDRWYSTREFGRHISALQNKVDLHTDPNKTYITDTNFQDVCQFLRSMKEHDEQLKRLSTWLKAHQPAGEINYGIIDQLIKNYDRDKLHPDVLPFIASYVIHPSDTVPNVLKNHWRTVPHHLEYWKDKFERVNKQSRMTYIGPTPEEAIMIVFSGIIDDLRGDKLTAHINKFKPYTTEDNINLMMTFVPEDWDKILRSEEK